MNDCYYDTRDWRSCKKEVEISTSAADNILTTYRWRRFESAGSGREMTSGRRPRMPDRFCRLRCLYILFHSFHGVQHRYMVT